MTDALKTPKQSARQYPKPPEGTWTEHHPELDTEPVSYEGSISPEFFELEREAIFKRAWLNVGRVEHLPARKGGFFTKEIPGLRTSLIVVRGMANAMKQHFGADITKHPNYRAALIEGAIFQNAAITAFDLKRELFSSHDRSLHVVYGVCNVGTMLVTSLPETPTTTEPSLHVAPQSAEEIGPLGDRIAQALAATELFA